MAKIYGALEVAQLEWFLDSGKPAASSYIYRVIYVSDLKQVMVSDGSNWIPFLNTSTNQTVNGNITFAGQQIFNGLHRLSVTTDSASTGAITALNNVTPVIEFTGAVTSISGILNSASGATVMLVNRTGGTIAVLDEDTGATAANRIRTGTGAQITLANNASILLTYVGDSRWHIVGGSGSGTGSGAVNFVTNGTAEADTQGWAVYADAAGTSPVDGTGGTANVTITRTTTTPLVGTASFLLAKDAANRQGQGWSYDFSIDLAYRAKVLQISFDYLVNSGTFVAGATGSNSDVTVWIYDVTNAVLIQPSNIKLFSNNASITDKFQASFQTASNSSSYRLIFHVTSTSASAYTLEVDNVSVSPSDYVFGTPVTDWQSYTPTFTGFGTVTNIEFQWRRAGDSLEVKGKATLGTSTATEARVSFPSGLTAAGTDKIPSLQIAGLGARPVANAETIQVLTEPSVSYFTFCRQEATLAGLTKQNGNAVANAQAFSFFARTPISGWSSSVQTSDSADTRVVSFVGSVGSGQVVTGGTTNITLTSVKDSHGVWTGSTYLVPVSGDYVVSGSLLTNAAMTPYIYKNGVWVTNANWTTASATVIGGGSVIIPNCVAGDILSLRSTQNGTVQAAYLCIQRISGPSAIAASETVAMAYSLSANQSASTTVSIKYDVREFDTHNAYSSATGQFTAPISGTYSISALGAALGATWGGQIHKNGSATAYKTILQGVVASGLGSGTTLIKLNAGETVEIRPSTSVTIYGGPLNSSSGAACTIAITKVGN